jgi:hypothetical protein
VLPPFSYLWHGRVAHRSQAIARPSFASLSLRQTVTVTQAVRDDSPAAQRADCTLLQAVHNNYLNNIFFQIYI